MQAGYEHGAEWLDQMMVYLKGNVDFLRSYLEENMPNIKLIEPEATYLLWLDCRSLNIETEKLNQLLIKKAGLALNKGTTFGIDGEGFLRINIGCPRSILEKALDKIKLIVDEM